MDVLLTLLGNHLPELAGMLVLYILVKKEVTRLEIKVSKLAQQFSDFLVGSALK